MRRGHQRGGNVSAMARDRDKPTVYFIRDRQHQLLFVNWVQYLIGERLAPIQSWSGGTESDSWEYKLAESRTIRVDIKAPKFRVRVTQSDGDRTAVRAVLDEAWQRTEAFDLGGGVWYKTRFASDVAMISSLGQLHFLRFMSEAVNRRVVGPVRFSNSVLLEFEQKHAEPNPFGTPNFTVDVTLRAPGPGRGPFSVLAAVNVATMVRAVLAYSTADPIDHPDLMMAFPAKQPEIDSAHRHLANANVGELMVDGVVLAPRIMGEFGTLAQQTGNYDIVRRVQGALFSYEQALHQESEFTALILLVTAIEALTVPNVSGWNQKRLVARFIDFVSQVAPEKVADTVAHDNFKQAFGNYTSMRRFLDDVYSRRSRPLHTGLVQHDVIGPMPNIAHESGMRVGMVSDLFRACMTSFLRAPFSSLVGHPAIAPGSGD